MISFDGCCMCAKRMARNFLIVSSVADWPCDVRSIMTSQMASVKGVNWVCWIGVTMQSSMSPAKRCSIKKSNSLEKINNFRFQIRMMKRNAISRSIANKWNYRLAFSTSWWIVTIYHSHSTLIMHAFVIAFRFSIEKSASNSFTFTFSPFRHFSCILCSKICNYASA